MGGHAYVIPGHLTSDRLAEAKQSAAVSMPFWRRLIGSNGSEGREVTFSGCAGEAEVSARVASHWAAAWYAKDHHRIASAHLTAYGFVPAAHDAGETEPMLFLPAGDLGYLEYVPAEQRDGDQPAFEIDHGIVEAGEGNPLLTRLDDVFGGFMREARCRCQLCDPEFGDATLDEGTRR